MTKPVVDGDWSLVTSPELLPSDRRTHAELKNAFSR
jgi:hypothetical protein